MSIISTIKRRFSKNSCTFITEEMTFIDTLLKDKNQIHKLINDTIQYKGNLTVKIRFYIAVLEYENTENFIDKNIKGRKIISLFIENGSLFQIINLSKYKTILTDNTDILATVKYDILTELSTNYDFSQVLQKYK